MGGAKKKDVWLLKALPGGERRPVLPLRRASPLRAMQMFGRRPPRPQLRVQSRPSRPQAQQAAAQCRTLQHQLRHMGQCGRVQLDARPGESYRLEQEAGQQVGGWKEGWGAAGAWMGGWSGGGGVCSQLMVAALQEQRLMETELEVTATLRSSDSRA